MEGTGEGGAARDIGVRLEALLGSRSVSWLVQELENAGAENTSYSSVYRYVKGQVVPPIEWLVGAARIFGVRAAWLTFGEGRIRDREVDPGAQDPQAAALHALWEAAEGLRPAGMSHQVNQLALSSMPGLVLWLGSDGIAFQTEAEQVAAGRMLGEALAAPLKALRLDPTEWPETVKAQYVGALLASLQPLVYLSWLNNVQRHTTANSEA